MQYYLGKNKNMKKIIIGILIGVVALLTMAIPVFAIAPPDTTPTIDAINVYRSCIETNDQLYVMQYNIYYAVPPSETVSEAFIFRLMNGATELKSTTAYAYHTSGYGRGIAAIYFSAAEVTAKGMGWVGAYTAVLSGNPTLTWTGTGCPYVTATTYDTWNDPMGSVLGTDVLTLAIDYTSDWGVGATTPLFITIGGSTTLSSYGEDYFTTSIPSLMTMQPDIFSAASIAAYYYERTNPSTYAASIGHTAWAGTWVDDMLQPTATALNISAAYAYGLVWAVITLTLLGLMVLKTGIKFEIILLVGGVMSIFGSLLHFLPMLIPIVIGFSLVILATWMLFWKPSNA